MNKGEVRVNGRVEKRSFFEHPIVPDAAARLDALGVILVEVFALEHKKMEAFRELWRIYLADCKRLGIEPVKANTTVM